MKNDFRAYLAASGQQMFGLLEELVRINSGSRNRIGVDAVGRRIAKALSPCGLALEIIRTPPVGDQLIFRTNCPSQTAGRLLLIGHMDTVFDADTKFTDYHEDETRAFGPGVIDMKGGLVVGIFAIMALYQAGLLEKIPLTFVLTSDEEIGSRWSEPLILREAAVSACAFVLEVGGRGGKIVTGRKGNFSASLTTRGKAGHAAFAGRAKASAITAMAHLILSIEALNNSKTGITANVGKISGGIGPNTVAESAEARVDFRFIRPDDGRLLEKRLKAIMDGPPVPGTTASMTILSGRPPMPENDANQQLFQRVRNIARDMDMTIASEFRAGVSDANLIAMAGTPVIDGLGPIGGADHSPREYMLKASLPQRTLLLAKILYDFSFGKGGPFGPVSRAKSDNDFTPGTAP